MKELNIQEKAKAYDEAKLRMSKAFNDNRCSIGFMNEIFPELAENGDERIRKEIIKLVKFYYGASLLCKHTVSKDDMVTFLEKKDEFMEINPTEFDIRLQALIGKFNSLPKEELIESLSFWLNRVQNKYEKQGEVITTKEVGNYDHKKVLETLINEQKPADKVEPKFHEGDWVVYKCDICQIVKREEGCNKLVTNFGIVKELVNERNLSTARLWTIQDIKDGDVICSGQIILLFKKWEDSDWNFVVAYAGIDISGKLQITNGHWLISNYIHPASKEQRDSLFAKIKEAGYEWDAEKKELKKIEQKSQRIVSAEAKEAMYDKPAWSEEEGRMLDEMYEFFDKRKFPSLKHCMDDYAKLIKFLKERVQLQNHWKPSKEQIKQLEWVAKQNKDNMIGKELMSLYQDLKKLKA